MKKILFLSFFVLLLPLLLLAQNENEDFDISGLSFEEKELYDYLAIEKNLIKTLATGMTDVKWRRYANLYEQYVDLFCFTKQLEKLKSKDSKEPEVDKNCQLSIEKLELFHPGNIKLICAKNGIFSDSCKEAHLNQYISETDRYISEKDSYINIKRQLDMSVRDETLIGRYSLNYKRSLNDFNNKKTSENWEKVNTNLKTLIEKACVRVYTTFVGKKPKEHRRASNFIDYKTLARDPLYKLALGLERNSNFAANQYEDRESPKDRKIRIDRENEKHPFEIESYEENFNFAAKPFWRERVIPRICFKPINEGLKFSQFFPPAVCNLHGEHSPFCYDAKKRFPLTKPVFDEDQQKKKKAKEMKVSEF